MFGNRNLKNSDLNTIGVLFIYVCIYAYRRNLEIINPRLSQQLHEASEGPSLCLALSLAILAWPWSLHLQSASGAAAIPAEFQTGRWNRMKGKTCELWIQFVLNKFVSKPHPTIFLNISLAKSKSHDHYSCKGGWEIFLRTHCCPNKVEFLLIRKKGRKDMEWVTAMPLSNSSCLNQLVEVFGKWIRERKKTRNRVKRREKQSL